VRKQNPAVHCRGLTNFHRYQPGKSYREGKTPFLERGISPSNLSDGEKNTSFSAQNAVSLWTGANSATVHSVGIQQEPSRHVGTAAEFVEHVVRFVVRSTTD